MRPAVAALRSRLDQLASGTRAAGPSWSTGLPALDAALGGGVARGRLTEVVGARAVGKTTLVRRVVGQTLARGGWVAIIDATRTLAPQDWAALGPRLVVIRPREAARGPWCADRLLRSGVFGLVVLDGAPPLARPITTRLSQLARDRDAAVLVVGGAAAASGRGSGPLSRGVAGGSGGGAATMGGGGTVRLRVTGPSRVVLEKGGPPATVTVPWTLPQVARLRPWGRVADRRGVASRPRRPWEPRVSAIERGRVAAVTPPRRGSRGSATAA